MANSDLIFRIGESKRINHVVSGPAGTTLTVPAVVANIWNEAGTQVVTSQPGGSEARTAANERNVYYVWAPNTAGKYRYDLLYTVGTETKAASGHVTVLSGASKLDKYVSRAQDWIQATGIGEVQRDQSYRQLMDCVLATARVYERDHPRRLTWEPVLTEGTFEYPLPSTTSNPTVTADKAWVNGFSHIETIEYPVDATVQNRVFFHPGDWLVEETRGKWMFRYDTPGAGEAARLTYTVPHTLDDSTDTLPTVHFEQICQYAAGMALLELANKFAGDMGSGSAGEVVGYRTKQQEHRQQAMDMMQKAKAAWAGGRSARKVARIRYMDDFDSVRLW